MSKTDEKSQTAKPVTLTSRARRAAKHHQAAERTRAKARHNARDGVQVGAHFDRIAASDEEKQSQELEDLPGPLVKGAGGEAGALRTSRRQHDRPVLP